MQLRNRSQDDLLTNMNPKWAYILYQQHNAYTKWAWPLKKPLPSITTHREITRVPHEGDFPFFVQWFSFHEIAHSESDVLPSSSTNHCKIIPPEEQSNQNRNRNCKQSTLEFWNVWHTLFFLWIVLLWFVCWTAWDSRRMFAECEMARIINFNPEMRHITLVSNESNHNCMLGSAWSRNLTNACVRPVPEVHELFPLRGLVREWCVKKLIKIVFTVKKQKTVAF